MNTLFELENVRCSYDKHYHEGLSKVVLEVAHLTIPKGKIIFIVGESGIGKSTILETLGMMNRTIVPGENVKFKFYASGADGIDLKAMWNKRDKVVSDFRLKNYSFIFQSTNLMKNFTAYENVAFTRMLQGFSRFSCFQRTRQTLADLGLEHIDELRMAQELSGGQQQRLAFARAVIPDFTVLFGDEPTGNLDAENAVRVMEILAHRITDNPETSAIIVSHDMHLATTFADVIIKIKKCIREKSHIDDEDIAYGVLDDTCMFYPTKDDKTEWSNGTVQYDAKEFETYLLRK